MAGETNAEVTIVVRAVDAATKVIRSIGLTVGKVLLAPLKSVANAVKGIFKQFFSLKGLLLGGGILGVIRSVVGGLSTSQTKFKEVFSSATQRGINAVDDAFTRLGASIRATLGNLVGAGSSGIAGFLDSISDWLRDNQAGIQKFFRDLVDTFREVAAIVRGLVSKRFSLGDMLWGDGEGMRKGLARQKEFDVALQHFEKNAKRVFGLNGGLTSIQQATESGDAGVRANARMVLDVYEGKLEEARAKLTTANPLTVAKGMVDAETEALRHATAAMTELNAAATTHAEIVSTFDHAGIADELGQVAGKAAAAAKEVDKLTPIIEGYLEVSEFADLAAGTITDSFEAIIRGTQKVGQAFASMVATVIGELGRLLLYKSLFNLLTSVFSIGSKLGGLDSIPGSTSSGALTPDYDFPQYSSGNPVPQLASGGTTRRAGVATVGENGPERVVLPAGAQVSPSQRSRGGGGDTINVYGARDPKATAAEVMYAKRRSAGLRRALA